MFTFSALFNLFIALVALVRIGFDLEPILKSKDYILFLFIVVSAVSSLCTAICIFSIRTAMRAGESSKFYRANALLWFLVPNGLMFGILFFGKLRHSDLKDWLDNKE